MSQQSDNLAEKQEIYTVRVVKLDDTVIFAKNLQHTNKQVVDAWAKAVQDGQTDFGDVKEARRVISRQKEQVLPRLWDQAVKEYGLYETFLVVDNLWQYPESRHDMPKAEFDAFFQSELKVHPAVKLMPQHFQEKLFGGDADQANYLMRKLVQSLLSLTHISWCPALKDSEDVYAGKIQLLADYFEPFAG